MDIKDYIIRYIIRKRYILEKDFKDIIDKNEYIISCFSNKKKDYNSLSYLIDFNLSQSDCIKLGNAIEKILNDIILDKNNKLINIKPKNKKNQREKDHLYINENQKIIYYAELKSNLNLDTEKCKSTISKCLEIYKELNEKYKEYTIKMYLIGVRYYDKKLIPKIIINKYKDIYDNVLGINNYFNELNIKFNFINEEKYKDFLNYIVRKMFIKNF